MPKNWILTAFGLLLTVSGTASAITPQQFDAMPCDARVQYLSQLLDGAQEWLGEHNKDAAEKLNAIMANGAYPFYGQFYENLQGVRKINSEDAAKPNNGGQQVFQVEHALSLTAKRNGVIVPVSYLLTVNRDFVPKAPLTYADEPVWPWNVSESYKTAALNLMKSVNDASLSYQDNRCKLYQQEYVLDAELEELTAEAPLLSENHHAYITGAGTFVDERGTKLTGLNLQKVSAVKKENLPSFEDLKSTQARIAKIDDLQNKMLADQTKADDIWDNTVKEIQDCFPAKCTYKK